MTIDEVLREMREMSEINSNFRIANDWADAIEAAMGDPVMKMVWERDAEIEQWRTTSQNLLEQMLDETKQNGMLREALTWYEDKVRTAQWGVLHHDIGRKARAALASETKP